MKITILTFLISFCILDSYAGDSSTIYGKQIDSLPSAPPSDSANTVKKGRVWLVGAANIVFWTGTYIALDKAWYSDYPKRALFIFLMTTANGYRWTNLGMFGRPIS